MSTVRLGMILHVPKLAICIISDNNILETRPQCTHTCDYISQQLNLADTEQQHQVYTRRSRHHYLQVILLHSVHLL